ncbi:DMT family transporter [Roseburia sp. OM04-10BH]|uniref:DMT family transporter n=1 Tax=unclassified Roseburia TaxID=2637578 RepID=UPI000E54CA12|nr:MULTISPECIES: DMT family transporter [unclassified Roseburia]RGI42042.1 DMT family transporter [Roseburia sp. OM04-10BH]RGI47455.1 DMT family transporter [Roseburia sp. OM03-7AC]RGI49596.1 DMT family transporter [Roseburia sp. OM03-18]RHV38076.1 DMT family transporter [Roseburia sp. OM04-15AA]RHV57765.1 DMT family transporter [Roseburia sp. OM04-10AA]
MKQQIKSSLILLLTATIWGVAFVAQSVGMEYIGPFTFNAIRCVLGGLVLIPVILVLKKKKEIGAENQEKEDKKTLWIGGIACGVILCIASNLQQFGIMEASVGKSGFFTALYIVMIPVIGIFIGKRPGIKLWFCVALAVVGMYLLCMKDGSFTIERADIMLLLCALAFSFHILVVDYFSPKVGGVKMSCIQFFVCGVLSAVGMLFTETPDISNIQAAWLPLLYAGLLSCGVGYTLQIVGQKGINPVIASLIMSLESVISALAGWVILGQVLSPKEILGCVLMFVAIIITQIPIGNKKTD